MDDLNLESNYTHDRAYTQSKFAVILFGGLPFLFLSNEDCCSRVLLCDASYLTLSSPRQPMSSHDATAISECMPTQCVQG